MGLFKYKKLKKLIHSLQDKGLITTDYLKSLGISNQLVYKYVKEGWLTRIGKGSFSAPNHQVSWKECVRTLQEQLHLHVHVGAKTTFHLLNKTHYLKKERIYLYHSKETYIPKWITSLSCFEESPLIIKKDSLFHDSELGIDSIDKIKISSLERAAIEQVELIGKTETFDETYKLFQGLTNLRSKRVQTLLVNCRSIKAKRIFLLFAEKVNYPWFKKIEIKSIDLGKGPRQIENGKKYHAQYQLITPEFDEGV